MIVLVFGIPFFFPVQIKSAVSLTVHYYIGKQFYLFTETSYMLRLLTKAIIRLNHCKNFKKCITLYRISGQ